MDKKIEIELDIEDAIYNEMVKIADEKNISVNELLEQFVKEGLERDEKWH